MYTLFVTVDVHPEKIDEFVVAITANAKAALGNEPGCRVFDVHRGSAHSAAWQADAEHFLVPDSRRVIFAEAVHVGSPAGDR